MMSLPLIPLLLLSGAVAPVPDPDKAPVAAEPQSQSGDIVVTARRREERIQEVPVAVSVLSGATLSEAGAFNVARIQQSQPALQFYSSNPRNTAINIRGLGAPFASGSSAFSSPGRIYSAPSHGLMKSNVRKSCASCTGS